MKDAKEEQQKLWLWYLVNTGLIFEDWNKIHPPNSHAKKKWNLLFLPWYRQKLSYSKHTSCRKVFWTEKSLNNWGFIDIMEVIGISSFFNLNFGGKFCSQLQKLALYKKNTLFYQNSLDKTYDIFNLNVLCTLRLIVEGTLLGKVKFICL